MNPTITHTPIAFDALGYMPKKFREDTLFKLHVLLSKLYTLKKCDLVTLHAKTIKMLYGRSAYNALLKATKDGLIERCEKYEAGEYSMRYGWSKAILNEGMEKKSWCSLIAEKMRQQHHQYLFSKYTPTMHYVQNVLQEIELPIDDLKSFVDSLPDKPANKKGKKTDEVYRRGKIYNDALSIKEGDMGYVSCKSNGRLFTSINRLERSVRGHITIAGEKVKEIDLSSSQPFLMGWMSGIKPLFEAVEAGEFYERINEHYDEPFDFSTPYGRSDFKLDYMSFAYQGNGGFRGVDKFQHREMNRAIEKAYPKLPEWINGYLARNGKNSLIHKLQREESDFFIKEILPLAQSLGMRVSPIHDGIAIGESRAEELRDLMVKRLSLKTSLNPVFTL